MNMELFVGLPIPLDIARYLLSTLGNRVPGCKLSFPEDLHITLRYLGEADSDEVVARLQAVRYGAFQLPISSLGRFKRHLWAAVDDAGNNLPRLKGKVDECLQGVGVPGPSRFVPHITLAEGEFAFPHDVELEHPFIEFVSMKLYKVCEDGRFREIQDFPFSPSVRLACVNDFHASLGNAPRLVHHLKQFTNQNPDSMIVFGGDNYFGDPASDALDGAPVSLLMRLLKVAYSAMGNHDYEYGKEMLIRWQTKGGFEFLCANIEHGSDICKPYAIAEIAGKRIAVLGLTTLDDMPSPETEASMDSYPLFDSAVAARACLGEIMVQGPDAVVALAHLGLKETAGSALAGNETITLCNQCPELDGVFAAHWHRFIKGTINGIAVAQGGGNGNGFAILDLVFDGSGRPHVTADYVKLDEKQPEDDETKALVRHAFDSTRPVLGLTVCTIARELANKNPMTGMIDITGSVFSNFITNLLLKTVECDAVMLYSGRLGTGFSSGPLSRYDFEKTLMFKNNLYVVSASGACIKRNVNLGMRTLHEDGSSPLAVAGMTVKIDPAKPVGHRLVSMYEPNGQAIDGDKTYTVVIDEFMQMGSMGFDFSDAMYKRLPDGNMRDIVYRFLANRKEIDDTTLRQLTAGWVNII